MTGTNSEVGAGQVPAVVRQIVRLVAPQAPDELTEANRLIGDLGFHSLALAELVFTLEDMFGLGAVSPEEVMTLNSVGDISVGDIVKLVADAVVKGDAHVPSIADVRALCAQYGAEWSPGR